MADGYLGNAHLKKTGVPIEWTPELIQEYTKCAEDPVYFARKYIKVVHVDKGLIALDMYPYQEQIVREISENRRVAVLTARQSGKALALDTPVPLFDGSWTTIADLKKGDVVVGSYGQPTTVTFKSEVHLKPSYKITFDSSCSPVIACEDHLWTVWDRYTRKFITKTTKQLATNYKVVNKRGYSEYRYTIPNIKPINYPHRDLPVDPYTLGCWLGDGASASNTFTCHNDDKQHYESRGIRFTSDTSYERNSSNTVFTSGIAELRPILRQLGLLYNKHIPHVYLTASVEQRTLLLQGLMDTDGFIDGQCNIQLSRNNQQLIDHVYQLITSLGFKVRVTHFERTNSTRMTFNTYQGSVTPISIPRKHNRLTVKKNNRYISSRSIKSIELTNTVPTQCITVDADDSLFAFGRDYILTHNTTAAVAIILHYILFNEFKKVGILANKGDSAREVLARIKLAYESLPKWLQQGVLEWNKGFIGLENGCEIYAGTTTSSAIRGKSLAFLYLDEVAYIEGYDEFFASVYPTISSGENTKLLMTSCVTADTYVWGKNGLSQVRDFIDQDQPINPKQGYFVDPYTVIGMDGMRAGRVMVNSGTATVQTIVTKYSQIECSLNHKLWAVTDGKYGWVESQNLKVGDWLAIKYNQRVYGNDDTIDVVLPFNKTWRDACWVTPPTVIDEPLSYLFGVYIAEGCFTKGGITLTMEDNQHIRQAISAVYPHNWYSDGLRHTITSRSFKAIFEHVGLASDGANSKSIPTRLLRMSEPNIKALLRGIFDGDGSVIIKNGVSAVSLVSTSKKLIEQVRMLLQNMGMLSCVYRKRMAPTSRVNVYSDLYVLELNGSHAVTFMNTVGFGLERKQNRFADKQRRVDAKDVIPYARSVLNIPKTNGYGGECGHINRTRVIEQMGSIKGVVESDLIWSQIKSIDRSESVVYDFSLDHVDGDEWCHSVAYNGIIGHQTPNGLNHFYKTCEGAREGTNGYRFVQVMWYDVPGRDEKWKQETLEALDHDYEKFNVEYCCQFQGSSGTLISGEKLKTLVIKQPEAKSEYVSQYVPPIENHIYCMLVDVSRGKGLDYSTFSIIDVTKMPYTQVCTFRDNKVGPADYASILYKFGSLYNNAYVLIELNDIGGQVADTLFFEYGYENMLFTEHGGRSGRRISSGFGKDVDRGIRTSKSVKAIGCSMLKLLVEQNQLLVNDEQTIEELKRFSKKGVSYEAESGHHDDMVMTLVLFAWLTGQTYFKNLTDIDTMLSLKEITEEQLSESMLPFGYILRGDEPRVTFTDSSGDVWLES